MVKKLQKGKSAKKLAGVQLSGTVKDSASQIWQAGLGAFTRAQAEGSKAFESLVKEGVSIQRKTQAAAEEKITEATSKMTHMANDITSKATGQWDKLENIFEERVAKALNKLGVPSAKDVGALIERIEVLNKAVQMMGFKVPGAAKPVAQPAAKAATKPAAKKAAVKPAAKKTVAAKPAAKKAATKAAAKPVGKPAVKATAKVVAKAAAPKARPARKAVAKSAAKPAAPAAQPVEAVTAAPTQA